MMSRILQKSCFYLHYLHCLHSVTSTLLESVSGVSKFWNWVDWHELGSGSTCFSKVLFLLTLPNQYNLKPT